MITYQAEKFTAIRSEIEPHIAAHWQFAASNQEDFGMEVDWGFYEALCRAGRLHVITARRAGALIGYFGCVVTTHPHRKSVLTASSAFLYVAPDPIRGLIMRGVLAESLKYFNGLGVKLYSYRSKNTHNIGKLLEKMGFKPVETVYSLAASEPP